MISRLLDLVAIYNVWSEMILYGTELANCHISAISFRRRDRVRKLFKGGNYLMEETIRGKTVAKIWEDATAHRVWPNCAMTLIWCFRCPRIFFWKVEAELGYLEIVSEKSASMENQVNYLNFLEIYILLHFKDWLRTFLYFKV